MHIIYIGEQNWLEQKKEPLYVLSEPDKKM